MAFLFNDLISVVYLLCVLEHQVRYDRNARDIIVRDWANFNCIWSNTAIIAFDNQITV